jgi:hypothetical protein
MGDKFGDMFDQLGDKLGGLDVGGHLDDAWKNTGNLFDQLVKSHVQISAVSKFCTK